MPRKCDNVRHMFLHPQYSGWEDTPQMGPFWPHESCYHALFVRVTKGTQIARFMGPTWGPSGADRTQVGPMLGPWTLLSVQFWCTRVWQNDKQPSATVLAAAVLTKENGYNIEIERLSVFMRIVLQGKIIVKICPAPVIQQQFWYNNVDGIWTSLTPVKLTFLIM